MLTMKTAGYHVLRVGIAITFLWVGILIFKNPESWGGLLLPWALDLIPAPIEQLMISTAIMDIAIGFLLLLDLWVWPAALLASIHLVIVLTTTGINEITVRDIGLLTATLALMADTWPEKFKIKLS